MCLLSSSFTVRESDSGTAQHSDNPQVWQSNKELENNMHIKVFSLSLESKSRRQNLYFSQCQKSAEDGVSFQHCLAGTDHGHSGVKNQASQEDEYHRLQFFLHHLLDGNCVHHLDGWSVVTATLTNSLTGLKCSLWER